MVATRFQLRSAGEQPDLSIAPRSTRMTSAYRGRARRHHVFDLIIDSWDTTIGYFSSTDLKTFTDHGVVVDKGNWTGDVSTSDPGHIGVASTSVSVDDGRVLLYYAGRGPCDPAGPFIRSSGLPQLHGRIMLAVAPADNDGAPAGPFIKQGPVTDYGASWRSLQHDDPGAVATDDTIYVFCKAIERAGEYNCRVFGVATTRRDQPCGPYRHHPRPVLSVPGGAETPRVFRLGDTWHMFTLCYRNVPDRPGRVYAHYATDDPTRWSLVDECVYEAASTRPGQGSSDMCPNLDAV